MAEFPAAIGITHSYDKMRRITQYMAPSKTTVYTYDNSGNRQSLSETCTSDQLSGYVDQTTGIEIKYRIKSSDYIYSNANKLQRLVEHMKDASEVEILTKTTNYQYDNNGNELMQTVEYQRPFATGMQETFGLAGFSEGNTGVINRLVESVSNEFDGFNRIKKTDRIKAGKRIVTEFIYNGDDLRITKTVKRSTTNYAPEITNYLYDRQHVILETDASDNLTARYKRAGRII